DTGGGVLVLRAVPAEDESLLASRQVDVLIVVEPGLAEKLRKGEKPSVKVLGREGEENSKIAVRRATAMLRKWSAEVKTARFARLGLPADFDAPVEIRDL